METAPLKSFAPSARTALINEVAARIAVVLAPGSSERVEQRSAVAALEKAIDAAGGGDAGRAAAAEQVAYTWFNRIIALRFMDANGYTGVGVVSPQAGVELGQAEILADAKRGDFDPEVVSPKVRETVSALLDGTRQSGDPQGEAYALLLAEYCRHWHRAMPFMFERAGDFTELLMPANLLADESVLNRAVKVMTEEVCQDVEVIGWLYQFYISERKDEVFAGFKKGKKASAAEIPAATQLFTPDWIVRYLVENSLGRLWMLNRPNSRLVDQMEYYIAPVDEQTDFLKISGPEELTVIDPACGSGHILTYAFDLLYAIYAEEGYAPTEIPGLILNTNLFGTEIDRRAGALAAFALTMKGRGRQRTFFHKQVEPNICVLEPIRFTPQELDLLVTPDGDRDEEIAFWNQFEHADIFGSLIAPDHVTAMRLWNPFCHVKAEAGLHDMPTVDRAEKLMMQSKYLSPRYSVVVANPPYMGQKNMSVTLAEWLKNAYPSWHADLFSAATCRYLRLLVDHGHIGLMSPFVWMFISTYKEMREHLLFQETLTTLVQLEYSGFDGATVPICAFTAERGHRRMKSSFVRLTDFVGAAKQAPNCKAIIEASSRAQKRDTDTGESMARHLYSIDVEDLSAIPGSPLAYWVSPKLRDSMINDTQLGEISEPRCGMNTGENARFVRNWWEVDRRRSLFEAESTAVAHDSGCKWFPYNKGGFYRKWYGNQQSVVAFDRENYEVLSKQGNHLPSRQFYFQPSVSWSKVSSSSPSFRYFPAGFIFDGAGMSLFADSPEQRMILLGLLNSNVSLAALAAIAPTLNFQSGDIARLPLPKGIDNSAVAHRVMELVATAKSDWDRQEISWNFNRDPLVGKASSVHGKLAELYDEVASEDGVSTETQRRLEEANNSDFIEAFGMNAELSAEVSVDEISLLSNPVFRFGATRAADQQLRRAEAVTDLISYSVGCMLGRYTLDEPGLVLADQGATLNDYLAKIPTPTFTPDADNVIPIVDGDWFEDDIVARFRQFLRVAFGEKHFEENLRFVTESLGVKDLRDYFVKSFYKDHVQRYKKRPIYWLFSSPRGSFNALIYMHRYTPSTVSTVLNEYLREYKAKLAASLENKERLAAGGGTAREQAGAQKEADRLRKVLLELNEYEHDVLYPLASQQIEIDLDDGVRVNYPKFGAALKKISGLEAAE